MTAESPPSMPPTRSGPAPDQAAPQRGWWRRNGWGLLTLPLVVALLLGVYAIDAYEQFWGSQPREPLAAGSDGWVALGGGRVRLDDLASAQVKDHAGKPLALPAGLAVWRVALELQAPEAQPKAAPSPSASSDALADIVNADPRSEPNGPFLGCVVTLEDERSRLYGAGPAELSRGDLPRPSCSLEQSYDGDTLASFHVEFYFVAPADAKPVAVRVELYRELPRYARLASAG